MIHAPRGNQLRLARGQRVSNITLFFQIVQERFGNTFLALNALYTCSSNFTMLETNGLTFLNYTIYLAVKSLK